MNRRSIVRPDEAKGLVAKVSVALFFTSLVIVLVANMLLPMQAQAYYNYGTVGVSAGSSQLTVQAGSSVSTSINVTPSSDSQTLGCGMAECPQVCAPEGSAEGYGCWDSRGNCTCAGTDYSTYYASVDASSSNSGVATAYVSGGTLVVSGVSAGSATINISASLRQWSGNSASVQVEVTPAPDPSPSPAPGGDTGGGSSSGGGGGGAYVPGPVANIPLEATPTDSRDDALNETVVETTAGNVYLVENNSFLKTGVELQKIIGTGDQMVFWSGPSSDQPNYSWTFYGTDLSADSPYLEFDPTITVSPLGTGDVANIMGQAKDGVVLEFAYEGKLPSDAAIYVKVKDSYADGTLLKLFCYDPSKKRFESVQEDIKVENGYASFKTNHCSVWALSTDNLADIEVKELNTAHAVSAQETIAVNDATTPVLPYVACGIVVLALIVLAVVLGVRHMRKKQSSVADVEQDDTPDDGAGTEGEDGNASSKGTEGTAGKEEEAGADGK